MTAPAPQLLLALPTPAHLAALRRVLATAIAAEDDLADVDEVHDLVRAVGTAEASEGVTSRQLRVTSRQIAPDGCDHGPEPDAEHTSHGDDLLSIDAAADIAGISRRTVQRRIDAGELTAIRLGARTTRICRSDLDTYIARSTA